MKTYSFQKGILALITFSILLLNSCDDRKNIEEYYFPIEELKRGKVYQYLTIDVDNNDTLFSRYSYSNTIETDSGVFFIQNKYDQTFFNDQLVTNEIVSNGVMIKSNQFMAVVPEKENQQIIQAEIIKNGAFPFSVSPTGGVTPMEMLLTDPKDSKEKIKLIRERKYLGDTIYTFRGVDLPAVVFAANEIRQFRHEDDGDFDHTSFATEIYAKGIGLISRKYNITDGQLESVLYDTFSMEIFEELASNYWNNNTDQ